jgi:hypothetical protein
MRNQAVMFAIILPPSDFCPDMLVHDGDQKRSQHVV